MVSGVHLPEGMREAEKLEEPIFIPSTKAEVGHDQNISFKEMNVLFGKSFKQMAGLGMLIRQISIELYKRAEKEAGEVKVLKWEALHITRSYTFVSP